MLFRMMFVLRKLLIDEFLTCQQQEQTIQYGVLRDVTKRLEVDEQGEALLIILLEVPLATEGSEATLILSLK